ncbi:Hypothetical Protein FCC1311_003352 [Hondaea fermentalgiana]|uniref:Uncharacterized protein n=1 Tax=Hondaea fermentalgiana TaxID=2315210 RepID=A0A2R5FZD7_9STRA|nr:Hypothetical Protein FCC1311_003352 [Hondaea fermentalgiana]|eukprot:GBG24117.1 Hypothetical Protein FCC1311_003352 [Hondaea fermentalgiana]
MSTPLASSKSWAPMSANVIREKVKRFVREFGNEDLAKIFSIDKLVEYEQDLREEDAVNFFSTVMEELFKKVYFTDGKHNEAMVRTKWDSDCEKMRLELKRKLANPSHTPKAAPFLLLGHLMENVIAPQASVDNDENLVIKRIWSLVRSGTCQSFVSFRQMACFLIFVLILILILVLVLVLMFAIEAPSTDVVFRIVERQEFVGLVFVSHTAHQGTRRSEQLELEFPSSRRPKLVFVVVFRRPCSHKSFDFSRNP